MEASALPHNDTTNNNMKDILQETKIKKTRSFSKEFSRSCKICNTNAKSKSKSYPWVHAIHGMSKFHTQRMHQTERFGLHVIIRSRAYFRLNLHPIAA